MTTYRVSAKNIEDFCDFLNICKEREIDFGTFVLTYDDLKTFVTAELEIGIPLNDLMELMRELLKEGKEKVFLGAPIYKNLDREILKIESIGSLDSEDDEFLKKVDAELGEFHAGLAVFQQIHDKLDRWGASHSYEFFDKLDWATYHLSVVRREPEMLEISDRLTKIFKQMIEYHDEYEDDMRNARCIDKYSETVEEMVENEYEDKMDTLESKYSALSEEFFEKLDVFIGENTFFRSTEKATL